MRLVSSDFKDQNNIPPEFTCDGSDISPQISWEDIPERVKSFALSMVDPDTGGRIVKSVHRREDLYNGPYVEQAPDLVVVPEDGYDLKGNLDRDTLTHKGPLVGMHTFDDASFYIRDHEISGDKFCITDVMPTILNLMGVPIPEDVDSSSLV